MKPGSETLKPAAELVHEIVRVFKVRRLYAAAHPQRVEVEAAAAGCIQELLAEFGAIDLAISEEALTHEEETVYRHPPGPESLAFLLFREGLRRVAFYPGLEPAELATFLDHVAATALTPGTETDLVARLWESNLVHIRYAFVEQLSDQEWVPPAAGREPFPEHAPIPLRDEELQAIEEPRLLIEGDATLYFLDDADLATLQAELDDEKSRTLVPESLTCLRELLMEPVHEDAGPLLAALAEVQASYLEQDDFDGVRTIHAVFEPCLQRSPEGSADRAAFADMRRSALEPAVLARLAARVDAGATDEAEGAGYYRAFGGEDLRALLSGVPELKKLCQRPIFMEAFAALAETNLPALRAAIAGDDPDVACAAAYLASLLADPCLIEPLGAALGSAESRVRLEALLALKQFQDRRTIEYIARRIDDPDPAVRLYALRHLIAHRHAAALPRVAELVERPPDQGRPLAERRLVFEAYGTLGGEGVVRTLAARLRLRRGLLRKLDPEEAACVVVGLAATRTETGRALVERAARSRHPLIQRVARQAMEAWAERAATAT
ncbi:MAG TPA: HEAT repeat domain-containing protein [Gemmatimonadota bacterium]|nr:HEAT repeat domain-containing protein [Gemmatimonadota bacterium]